MTPAEAYTLALVLAATSSDCRQELCTDIATDLALSNDFSFEDRLAMRDAAAMVIRTRHPEVDLLYSVQLALDCYLSGVG